MEVKTEQPEALPEIEEMRLLRQAQMDLSGGIALTGPMAFLSLASLVLVVGLTLYKIVKFRLNKGYMVIVNKD
jgi:hypothetical protein